MGRLIAVAVESSIVRRGPSIVARMLWRGGTSVTSLIRGVAAPLYYPVDTRREYGLYEIAVLFGLPLIFLTRYQSVRLADRVPFDFLMEGVLGFPIMNNTR